MKVALTADVHLTQDREAGLERYGALENVLDTMQEDNVSTLIIAGDLFDKACSHYNEFEAICEAHEETDMYVIPGNHDSHISSEHFRADNLQIITEPTVTRLSDNGLAFLFVPYEPDTTMAEITADFVDTLPEQWILVGHGDYLGGQRRESDSYESGTYMPINANDLRQLNPQWALLGHIHQRQTTDNVHYPGSPHGLHINETGPRFFTVLDTETGNLHDKRIDTRPIYYNESITVLPLQDEAAYIEEQINQMLEDWGIDENKYEDVQLRLTVRGYTQNIDRLEQVIRGTLPSSVSFYAEDGGPDLSAVNILHNQERAQIVAAVKEKIASTSDVITNKGLRTQDVIEAAMEIMFAE